MLIDPENPINKLCAQGMMLEGEGKPGEASTLFYQAWDDAANNKEKFIAAHYVARHQQNVEDKLKWDEIALDLALNIDDEEIKGALPSLYLNIGKCYEDLRDFVKAHDNYSLALGYTSFLHDDGYGNMIKSGINNGLERVK